MFSGLKIGKSSQDRNYSRQESQRLAGSGARPEAGTKSLFAVLDIHLYYQDLYRREAGNRNISFYLNCAGESSPANGWVDIEPA